MNHKEIERWHRLKNLKRAAQVLAVGVVALLVVGYLLSRFFGHREEEFQPPPGMATGIRIDKFSYSSPGAHPWELEASSALVSDSLDRVTLKDPKVTYRGGDGGHIVLSASTGELDRKSRNVSLEGNVTIRFKDMVFEAAQMSYSHEALSAQTVSDVSLKGDSLSLTGKGLKLLVESEQVVIEDDVNARLFNVKWVEPGRKLPM